MKTTTKIIALLCLFVLAHVTSLKAQSGTVLRVKYLLEYNKTTCRYEAKIVIDSIVNNLNASAVGDRAQLNSQYTIVTPAISTITIGNKFNPLKDNQTQTSVTPIDWNISSIAEAPGADPAHNFYSVTPNFSNAFFNTLHPKDTVRLFDFIMTNVTCNSELPRLYIIGVDPPSDAEGMNGGAFEPGYVIGRPTPNDYGGNLPTKGPPQPLLSSTTTCTAGISIDLTASTSACLSPLTYAWTGPNNYTSTSQDVNIPSGAFNVIGGNYQVIVTDVIGCKDTLITPAFPKPSAGADVFLCAPGDVTLNGTGPATGTWTASASNPPGSSISGNIVTLTSEGTYAYVYNANNCGDTILLNLGSANAGADPAAPLECFSSDIFTLSATGTGTWTVKSGSPGTAVFSDPNSPTSTVSQFSAPGTYILVWTSNGCTDEVTVETLNNCGLCNISNNSIAQPDLPAICSPSDPIAITGSSPIPTPGSFLWQFSLNGGPFSDAPGTNNAQNYTTPSLNGGVYSYRRLYTKSADPVCTDTSNIVDITVNQTPSIPTSLTANPNPACLGNTINLSVSPVAGGVFNWTSSGTTNGLVPSTANTTTMTPTDAGTYTVSVNVTVNGCQSPTANINVDVVNTPATPSNITSTDPTSCGGSNGSISINGVSPNTSYVVTYRKNGTLTTLTLTSNGSGVIVISNLTAGTYTDFSISLAGCPSGVNPGPIILLDPNSPPAPANLMATDSEICVGATTTLTAIGVSGATFIWTSSNTSVLAPQANSSTNTITMIGLSPGTSTVSVVQTLGGCVSSPASLPITVIAGPPTPANPGTSDPTTCNGDDGSIAFTNYLPNTTYNVTYLRNGVTVNISVTTDVNGVLIIPNLTAGTYTGISVSNLAGCTSGTLAGPITLSDPGNTIPSNLNASPNPACLGEPVTITVDNVPGGVYTWTTSGGNLSSSTSNQVVLNSGAPGLFTVSVTLTAAGCTSPPATIQVYFKSNCYNPDFGVTFAGIPLPGDLSTNDDGDGSFLNNPIPVGSNPSACLPVINGDGTYTFTCSTVGEYNFVVPTCVLQQCTNVPLSITVLQEESQTNPPIAHTDYADTKTNVPVKIFILSNDKCQSQPACSLGTPTIVTNPVNGSYNIGTSVYTPNAGFFGRDSFRYSICQTPVTPQACDEEWVYIWVYPSSANNFTNAMDDYNQTNLNTVLVANVNTGVRANDTDIENHTITVSGFSSTVPGKGSLVLNGDGSYTFTPATGYIGPVDFPYNLFDNGNPIANDSATLHLLVLASQPTGIIGDFVWNDRNGDGIQNSGEPGIPNATVTLYNSEGGFISNTVTDGTGRYLFRDVLSGDYYIEFNAGTGFIPTFPNIGSPSTDNNITGAFGLGTTNLFTVIGGTEDLTIDGGFYQCSKIGSYVWYDVNKNDIRDLVENGINGLRVELYRNSNGWSLFDFQYTGNNPDPTKPSDDGWFEFCAPPGNYYLKFILPPNNLLVPVKPFIGTDKNRDSDVNNANGPVTTPSFALGSGQNKTDLGAGFYPMAQAGNLVWLDENSDGIQDQNEPKISGVKVEAYYAENNQFITSAMTNESGVYNLEYLPQDEVYYRFTLPSNLNYIATYPNFGDDRSNSDVDHSYGPNTTRKIKMISDQKNVNIDFGVAAFSALPVKWSYINVEKGEKGNLVQWGTEYEINLSHYEVERLVGNEREYTAISEKIQPNRGQELIKKYEFFDLNTSIGWHHYRVKQTDYDGKFTYSDIKSVLNEGEMEVSVYPNPMTDKLNVDFSLLKKSEVKISVTGIKGETLTQLSNTKLFEEGKHAVTLDMTSYSAGSYTISIEINGNSFNKIIIKK